MFECFNVGKSELFEVLEPKDVFRTHLNIYDGAFLPKHLTAFSY